MPKVNEAAIDNMSDKAKEALKDGPSPVGEVVAPQPDNIIRDDGLPPSSRFSLGEILVGSPGEVDYFVFDMNAPDNGFSEDDFNNAIIEGFEVGTDKIVVVNADNSLLRQQQTGAGSDIDGDGADDGGFIRVEYESVVGQPPMEWVIVHTRDVSPSMNDVLIFQNDPFAVA